MGRIYFNISKKCLMIRAAQMWGKIDRSIFPSIPTAELSQHSIIQVPSKSPLRSFSALQLPRCELGGGHMGQGIRPALCLHPLVLALLLQVTISLRP